MSSLPPPQPPPHLLPPPPVAYAVRDPRDVDGEHLRTLSICHYVWGGLLALFSCFAIIYVVLGALVVSGQFPMGPTPAPGAAAAPGQPPPAWFGWFFIGFGTVFLLLGWTLAACTLASGRALARRRRRVFSIVIAAVNCAMFPIGTVLGVFSLMVLLRDSVRRAYDEAAATAAAPAAVPAFAPAGGSQQR